MCRPWTWQVDRLGEGSAPLGPCCAGPNWAEGLKHWFMWACSMRCRIKIAIHLL